MEKDREPERTGSGVQDYYESADPLLEIRDVSLTYRTGKSQVLALSGVNLNVYRNEFVCILGPSGCGKSTLLKIIAGFQKPTEGEILLDGYPIDGISWHRGVVFQQANLFEWLDVEKNVNFGLRMRHLPKQEIEEKTRSILETVGFEEFAGKKVYELSGGMKQRVGIARALINDPDILLMDEPFSALDALTKEQMQDFTRDLWWKTGKTIFFITHDVDEAMVLGTRVVVLSKRPGTVILDRELTYTRSMEQSYDKSVRYTDSYYHTREDLLHHISRPERISPDLCGAAI